MLYALHVHEDARNDLRELARLESEAADKIVATLAAISEDQGLLDALLIDGYGSHRGDSDLFKVSKWRSQWRTRALWRLKVVELDRSGLQYRIIYAFLPGCREFHVLGVVHRDFNYASDATFTERVRRAYDALQ